MTNEQIDFEFKEHLEQCTPDSLCAACKRKKNCILEGCNNPSKGTGSGLCVEHWHDAEVENV